MGRAAGIDLTQSYQGTPDWKKVWDAGYRYAFIKASEGASYREEYHDQWAGSGAVGMLRANYHFLRARKDVSPSYQATFFKSWASVGELPPVVDFEDAEAHRILGLSGAFILEYLRTFLIHVEAQWGKVPIVYTGMWYLWELFADSPDYDARWLAKYPAWLADYNHDAEAEPDRPSWWPWTFFQWTSSGQVPGIINRVDLNVFNGSYDDLRVWAGLDGGVMSNIYDKTVGNGNKAWGGLISSMDKKLDIPALSAGTDFLVMNCVSQEVSGTQPYLDAGFKTWAQRTNKPVFAMVAIDRQMFWNQEIELPKFQTRGMWASETVRAILHQLRINGITDAEWDSHELDISATDGGWVNTHAIVLYMATYKQRVNGEGIGGAWQQAMCEDILNPLSSLMEGGYMPRMPFLVMAHNDWWDIYVKDVHWTMNNNVASKQVAGYGTMRLWGKEEMGLITDAAPMAIPVATVGELRQYVPDDTYAYPQTQNNPYLMFAWSYNRLRAINMFYPNADVTTLTAVLWHNTPEKLNEFLHVTPAPQPVLTTIVITPKTVSLQKGETSQFSAVGLDQFGKVMAVQPVFTWTATGGTVSANGLYTAPIVAGSYVVMAASGTVQDTAQVTVADIAQTPILDYMLWTLARMKERKTGDRTPRDRNVAVMITRMEELIAYNGYYLKDF